MVIIWAIDGKQRCSNVESFRRNGFRISKNVERYLIKYQTAAETEDGKILLDENGLPRYEVKECDIRGKCYSDLPEKLQRSFNEYNFEVTQYLNCSNEDIEYHIRRYNASKPMSVAQKGNYPSGESSMPVLQRQLRRSISSRIKGITGFLSLPTGQWIG